MSKTTIFLYGLQLLWNKYNGYRTARVTETDKLWYDAKHYIGNEHRDIGFKLGMGENVTIKAAIMAKHGNSMRIWRGC